MNKIKLIGIVLLAASLGSCKDFLDIEPQAKLASYDYMEKEDQAENAVASMYDLLRRTDGSGPDGAWIDHHHEFMTGSTNSDDADKGSIPNDMDDLNKVISYTALSTTMMSKAFYLHGFWGISRANYVMTNITKESNPLSADLKKRIQGEAHFFRAYYYWMLLRHYGGVPIFRESVDPSQFGTVGRASWTETADFIIEEFQNAANMLPERSGYPAEEIGRATKGAALAFMARVMTFRLGVDPGSHSTTWQNVIDVTNQIINSGEYALHANYAELHDEYVKNTSESIFEIQATGGSGGIQLPFWGVQGARTSYNGEGPAGGGWGFHAPTQNLVDEFEEGDPRLSATVYGPGFNNSVVFGIVRNIDRSQDSFTNFLSRKTALDRRPSPGSGKQWMLMRYADILLMNAEANYMNGNEAAARTALNQVRTRARNSSYAKGYILGDPLGYPYPESTAGLLPDVTASGQALLDAIWHERRVEFGCEDLRTWDLIRTGRLRERVELVKDFQRNPANPQYLNNGETAYIPGVRANIVKASLPGKDGKVIPVLPLPEGEVTIWGLEKNPGNSGYTQN